MERLRKTGGRISATGWGAVMVACDLVELIRRRSLIYASSAAMLAILLVILLPGAGGGHAAAEVPAVPAAPAPESEATPDTPASQQSAAQDKFVEVGGYSLNLPDGWHNSSRPPGSAFAATSADGLATSTLWIRRNPGLDFDAFEKRSKRSLAKLGRNVTVLSKVDGDSVADRSVELGAEVPLGSDLLPADQQLTSTYRVTLRASGPFRFYLATTIQPGSPDSLLAQSRELGHSLRPWLSNTA
jgi:hypothetical protein